MHDMQRIDRFYYLLTSPWLRCKGQDVAWLYTCNKCYLYPRKWDNIFKFYFCELLFFKKIYFYYFLSALSFLKHGENKFYNLLE